MVTLASKLKWSFQNRTFPPSSWNKNGAKIQETVSTEEIAAGRPLNPQDI
jgi:hypothetical protein